MQNTTAVIEDRRGQIASLYLKGTYQADIATAVGCSQQQVSYDLQIIRRLWLEKTVRDFDAAKAEELARLDKVEAECWGSWEKSKLQRETTVQEKNNGRTKVSRRLEDQVGNPAYLEMVLKCIDRRCQILGLDAPKRFTIEWDLLTDTQMERLARGEPVQSVLAHPLEPPALSMPSSDYADADG